METKHWNVCLINGYITACDPGQLTTSSYNKRYTRQELSRKMNLTGYCEHLPKIVVCEIGDDFLTVSISGQRHKVHTGGHVDTPRKGLSYAYSEATLYLKAEE